MARVAALLLAVVLAFASGDARSIVDPCLSSIVVTAPTHPAADEPIGLRASSGLLFGAGTIMGAATLVNGVVVLDVVVTDDPAAFPGYKRTAETFQDAQAFVGPLVPGTYAIHATIRNVTGGVEAPPCVLQASGVSVTPQGGAVRIALAVEFYNATLDRYFVTADEEIAALDAGVHPGWTRTGEAFPVYAPDGSDGRGWSVCRFYGLPQAGLDSHFISARFDECNAMREPPFHPSWVIERSEAFDAPLPDTLTGQCPFGSLPIHRFWNPRNGDHRYVVSTPLRARLVADGWIAEGDGPDAVALCTARVPPP